MAQRPRCLLTGSLLLVLAMALLGGNRPAAALDQETTPSWMALGTIGPSNIRMAAPSPEWPEELAILAVREDCPPLGCRQISFVRTSASRVASCSSFPCQTALAPFTW